MEAPVGAGGVGASYAKPGLAFEPARHWIAHPTNGLGSDAHCGEGISPLRLLRQLSAAARHRRPGWRIPLNQIYHKLGT